MDLDINKLEQELQGIFQERHAVTERIRSFAPGRGRGRGMGPPGGPLPGRGPPGRVAYPSQAERLEGSGPVHSRPVPGQPYGRGPERTPASNGYPVRSPRDTPRSSVMDRLGPRNSQDRRNSAADLPATTAAASASDPANSRKRLLSAVVVDGETRLPSQDDENMTAKRPRPDDSEDNPAAKKRNRRMFGFLNQTLQKCRDESVDFRKSRVAQQRDEALKRAEERKREDLIKFKADFKREMAAKRQAEVNLKRELGMQADIKRAEINLVQRVLLRGKIANFIQTTAGPPLCWLPGKPNAATQQLLLKEQEKLEAFKVEEAAKLETKRQQVKENVAAMARAADAAAARREAAAQAAVEAREAAKAAGSQAAAGVPAEDATEADVTAEDVAEQDNEGVAGDDDVEEGAYVVLDEEEEEDDDMGAPPADTNAQPDRATNGSQAEPMDDDRYVATAYSAGEAEYDRPHDAHSEPLPDDPAAPMQLSEQDQHAPNVSSVQAVTDQQEPADGSHTADAQAHPKQQTANLSAGTVQELQEAVTELEVPDTEEGLQAMQTDAQ